MPPRPTLPGQSAASVPGIGTDASLLLLVCKCPSLLPSGHYLSVHFASMTHTCTAVYTGHNRTLTLVKRSHRPPPPAMIPQIKPASRPSLVTHLFVPALFPAFAPF